jgi:hypothetical protein
MEEITRRDAVGLGTLAGALTLIGLTPTQATSQEKKKIEFDEKADRARVIECGMTETEADCWELIAKAAGKFFELPELHPMDKQEVAQAIHIVQNKLLSRPTYRKYLELAKGKKK